MPSFEYELRFLEAALPLLEEYLLSQEIYWSIGAQSPSGSPPYPQLTLGAVLLFSARALARAQTADQQAALARVGEELDLIHARWRTAWGKKAVREFGARLKLWRNFLEDYREHPEANIDRYPYESRRRVQLHMLSAQTTEVPQAEAEMLRGLDRLLQAVFLAGPFIWDDELTSSFPPDPYWYLYGKLKKS